jgi:hypothetical protein
MNHGKKARRNGGLRSLGLVTWIRFTSSRFSDMNFLDIHLGMQQTYNRLDEILKDMK